MIMTPGVIACYAAVGRYGKPAWVCGFKNLLTSGKIISMVHVSCKCQIWLTLLVFFPPILYQSISCKVFTVQKLAQFFLILYNLIPVVFRISIVILNKYSNVALKIHQLNTLWGERCLQPTLCLC
jgi:hypothetical protein